MKIMNWSLAFLGFIFSNCSNSPNPKEKATTITSPQKRDSAYKIHESATPKQSLDSLHHPYSDAYLTHLPLRRVAELFVLDSIEPLDNWVTIACLDSLFDKNAETRAYFFPACLKIISKSDGALSEIVGLKLIEWGKKYPDEFATKIPSLNEGLINDFVSLIAYELSFADKPVKDAADFTDLIINSCINCDSIQNNRLKKFKKQILKEVKLLL